MPSQPLRKSSAQGASVGPDEYDFVPPVLRERIDPVRGIAEMEQSIAAIKAGRVVATDGEKFLAELGAEIKRLKA